jgi:hypothetical protein
VETKYLQDPRLTNKEIAAHVEDVVRIPPVTGITADATGNLYFSAMTEDGVLKMEADGFYYFPNSQAPRVNHPYEAFKITLP